MTQNLYITYLYKVPNIDPVYQNVDSAASMYDCFQRIYQISSESILKNLTEVDEHILITEETAKNPIKSVKDLLIDIFYQVYDIWKDGDCNIFLTDLDVLMVKPTIIFGRFKEFRMFNGTKVGPFDLKGCPTLNAGVRYYPCTMCEDVWELGRSMIDGTKDMPWSYDQYVYNKMFYSQNLPSPIDFYPELNYNIPAGSTEDKCNLSVLPLEQVNIIHFHSTRGIKGAYKKMRDMRDKFGLDK